MKKKLSIYCAHPISGLSYEEVVNYYEGIVDYLESIGYDVLHPMTGKAFLRNEKEFKSEGYGTPVSTNQAIKERDQWMVRNADVILVDFAGASSVSIGCASELAWGDLLGKHTVVVMEKDNVHRHAFILEEADITFEALKEAKDYLKKLVEGKI